MRPATHRIRLPRRLLRPPNAHYPEPPCPRQFSHKPPRLLLITNRSTPRPQLPFLYPTGQYLSNGQIFRLFSISANHKKFIKETARQTVKYTVLIWIVTTCFSLASFGILSERQERAFPSPHEWSLITRIRFRRGKWWQVPENNEDEGFPNWARVYSELQSAMNRLENPTKDGAGLVEQEEGGLMVPGVGKAGYDLTAKSEEWRQGYYEVLLGMARAAERLEGWVTDKWRRNVWAPEFVASPTNPRPKATLPGMPPVPEEDQRVPAAEAPETFYLKIITSKGFTTNQRLTAALGYADWLAFRKLPDSAEEMYRWALDIAISGLPIPDPSTTINRTSGVLSSTAPKEHITPNLVYAATNLATFHAEQGNIIAALPILISLLRARLTADPAPPPPPAEEPDSSLTGTLLSLLNEPDYPPLPPTGDEPLLRREEDRCEEAALKSYIGEILFATAGSSPSQRQQGLSWVRDAVSTAKIAQSLAPIANDDERRKKCEQCEEVGLESWGKIMTYLAAEAHEKRDAAKSRSLHGLMWKLWGTQKLDEDVQNLEGEEEGVTMRLNKLRGKMLKEEYEDMDRKYARTFVF
ncbi:hypothetical protein BU26DRAFT_514467 [Trematosphaeria pertusa]|uniref:MFS maltose permease n=1 Tax=Trematosphaeria pertusa TaxID=390896 RepID=A0A6A6IZK0_9PLEO|nr:uncharacterized protein BU26DRAFT_514467 [Trematosphaeria pertusa]KAF2254583.1 hypothetical protein BU26DRAFT_514467 [Trematosphaeria pertusa]